MRLNNLGYFSESRVFPYIAIVNSIVGMRWYALFARMHGYFFYFPFPCWFI